MNLHNDLLRAHIPHDCSQCCRKCPQRTIACTDFYPSNSRIFLDYVINRIRIDIPKSKDIILRRYIKTNPDVDGGVDDGIETLDGYYVQMINDTLELIRTGKAGYLYTFGQIQDVMRFEPYIQVKYIPDAGAYEIKLEKENG